MIEFVKTLNSLTWPASFVVVGLAIVVYYVIKLFVDWFKTWS